jgi:hypothetical protein
MAGAFTHMAVVSAALTQFPGASKLGAPLRRYSNFLTLGSVSPDIPYLAYLAGGGFKWADVMHYHQTNGIVHNGLHSLQYSKLKGKEWDCQLAWLAGFAGHLVTDATIHPIVEAIVGPYTDKNSRAPHMECEMVQDIMILKEVMGLELSAAQYTNHFRDCQTNSAFSAVEEFWAELAKINCPAGEKLSVSSVLDSYAALIDTAEGGSKFAKVCRHFDSSLVYRTSDDLKNNHQDLVRKYYQNIVLPNGLPGTFKINGFDFAVSNLVTVWSKIQSALFTTEKISEILPNWNLDTGVDQVTGKRTYWS